MEVPRSVGIARERACIEDPEGADLRVAILPQHIKPLLEKGVDVFVESGCGQGLGLRDGHYQAVGAVVEGGNSIYEKDVVVKIKGPPEDVFEHFRAGSTMFCMAHLPMYPDRANELRKRHVNVIAMEDVREDSFIMDDHEIRGRLGAKSAFDSFLTKLPPQDRHVVIHGYSPLLDGAIRFLGLAEIADLTVVPVGRNVNRCVFENEKNLIIHDSSANSSCDLRKIRGQFFDLGTFSCNTSDPLLSEVISGGKLPEIGKRRIECLHETGRAGARFGLENTFERTCFGVEWPEVLVIGYGNVALGAIDYIVSQNIPVKVLNRHHTASKDFPTQLSRANLVINGAINTVNRSAFCYVITAEHVMHYMRPGTVLVDLIGGTQTDKSSVEVVKGCTSIKSPSFEVSGVTVASVFGWPSLYEFEKVATRYSSQIASVLVEDGGLLEGITKISPGIRNALVLGPFQAENDKVSVGEV